MNQAALLSSAQALVGLAILAYGLYLGFEQLRQVEWRVPSWLRWSPRQDDLHVLVDMAARFRDAGNTRAVDACQSLIAELLKP